jgi:hypothetical protein
LSAIKRKKDVPMSTLGLALLSIAVLCCTASATTTDELILPSGGLMAAFQDNVTGCAGTGCAGLTISSLAGTLSISGIINGWTITVVSGVSKSPILTPQALNVSSFTVSCNSEQECTSGAAGELEVKFSDINFSVPVGGGGFLTNYSGTIAGGGVTSTSENAYLDNTNTLFAETNLIGADGPFSTSSFNRDPAVQPSRSCQIAFVAVLSNCSAAHPLGEPSGSCGAAFSGCRRASARRGVRAELPDLGSTALQLAAPSLPYRFIR